MIFAPKGNLITNGDFEDNALGAPPQDWISVNTVVGGPTVAFTGERGAVLGADPDEPAVLYQDVNVVPTHRYQLTFQTAGFPPATGDLVVQVRWLDHCCADVGVGLHVYVEPQAGAIEAGTWIAQTHLTDMVPMGTCMARILFTRGVRAEHGANVLDAVSFADIV